MVGLLDHTDAFHDHDTALADQALLLDLYKRFGALTRPYLASAIQEERSNIALRDWVSAASNMFGNLLDACIPRELQGLEAAELKATKAKLIDKINEDIDVVDDHELELLIENTSRSVINAWLTDLNRHCEPGIVLNSFLVRRSAREELLETALKPYSLDNFRDVFVYAMSRFSESLFDTDDVSVKLPMKLVLLPFAVDTDTHGRFALYREHDLPEVTGPKKIPERPDFPYTLFDLESFCIRQISSWKQTIAENFSDGALLMPEMAIPESSAGKFFENTERLARYELGSVPLDYQQYARIMSKFTDNLREENLSEIVVRNGISIRYDNNNMRLQEDHDEHVGRFGTDIKIFKAMRAATELELSNAS